MRTPPLPVFTLLYVAGQKDDPVAPPEGGYSEPSSTVVISAFSTGTGSGELSNTFGFENDRVGQLSLSYSGVSGATVESWAFASDQDGDVPLILLTSGRLFGLNGATRAPAVIGSYHYRWSLMGVAVKPVMPMSGDGDSYVEVGLR